jgi:2-polyprenyl-3-methyl-5-hydroxy-6-metoxy-1,4-benzoquinol methylase
MAAGRVDAVVIQPVLEHVLDPSHVVREIQRVLRNGGFV